jgi:hypothetical protein
MDFSSQKLCNETSLGQNQGRYVLGRFVRGRFIRVAKTDIGLSPSLMFKAPYFMLCIGIVFKKIYDCKSCIYCQDVLRSPILKILKLYVERDKKDFIFCSFYYFQLWGHINLFLQRDVYIESFSKRRRNLQRILIRGNAGKMCLVSCLNSSFFLKPVFPRNSLIFHLL